MKKTTTIDLEEMLSSDNQTHSLHHSFISPRKREDKSNEEEVAGSGTGVAVGGWWVVVRGSDGRRQRSMGTSATRPRLPPRPAPACLPRPASAKPNPEKAL